MDVSKNYNNHTYCDDDNKIKVIKMMIMKRISVIMIVMVTIIIKLINDYTDDMNKHTNEYNAKMVIMMKIRFIIVMTYFFIMIPITRITIIIMRDMFVPLSFKNIF